MNNVTKVTYYLLTCYLICNFFLEKNKKIKRNNT